MRRVFADAWFYIALLDRDDAWHAEAVQFAKRDDLLFVTTRWVLTEVANALGATAVRKQAVALLQSIDDDPETIVVRNSDEIYGHGLKLFGMRPDKTWSLTDCISFVVMEQDGIREALTGDRHFSQAGFAPLFAT